jgi:hypothetical protein
MMKENSFSINHKFFWAKKAQPIKVTMSVTCKSCFKTQNIVYLRESQDYKGYPEFSDKNMTGSLNQNTSFINV